MWSSFGLKDDESHASNPNLGSFSSCATGLLSLCQNTSNAYSTTMAGPKFSIRNIYNHILRHTWMSMRTHTFFLES